MKTKTAKQIEQQNRANELQRKGWKNIPKTTFWISKNADFCNVKTGKVKPAPKTITIPTGRIKTEKIILWLFKGEKIRNNKRVVYINGNKVDKQPENLKYRSLEINKETVNANNLKRALRCYFELARKYKATIGGLTTRIFIYTVIKYRQFDKRNEKEPFFSVFIDYMDDYTTNSTKLAKRYDLTIKDTCKIIAKYTNKLIKETLTDLQAGRLTLKPYTPTKREVKKRIKDFLKSLQECTTAPKKEP